MTLVDSKEDRRCINVIEKWKSQNRVSRITHILQRITILPAIREYIHNNGSFYNGLIFELMSKSVHVDVM